ncbi:MAG: SCO family protein [Acidobacteria bacterium]|nr:SCO family protein [Acidobacteriota bacterium]
MNSKVAPLLICLLLMLPVDSAPAPQAEQKTVNVKLLDLELVDQDGRKVKFRSEVLGNRVAALVPFYTTCTTAYPILIYIFTRLQDMLEERLGQEVVLISVSVDPKTDIPVRLRAFARRHKAKPGWVFLTGDMNSLSSVLAGVGIEYIVGQSLDEHNHIPLTLVGSSGGEWKRFYGYPPPEVLLTQIRHALETRGNAGGTK